MSENYIFGFKDVLAWKVLPFWKSIFSRLNVGVTYIVAIRNPVEVAASFNKMFVSFGYLKEHLVRIYILWLESAVTIMTETAGANRLVIDYDQLLLDPRLQIFRMAEAIDVEKSKISKKNLQEYGDEFIDKGLRNHNSPVDQMKKIPFLQS